MMPVKRYSRRGLLFAAAVCLSCGTKTGGPLKLPAELPGGFRLVDSATLATEEVPGLVRSYGLAAASRARYTGPLDLTVTVYEMTAATSAFELAQKWRVEGDSLFFYVGKRFITLHAKKSSQPQLNEVAKALEALLR
jgi:hypothetical protein